MVTLSVQGKQNAKMVFHTLMQTAVPGSPAYIHSAHRHVVIGPNKGINKAVAKGPIVMITAGRRSKRDGLWLCLHNCEAPTRPQAKLRPLSSIKVSAVSIPHDMTQGIWDPRPHSSTLTFPPNSCSTTTRIDILGFSHPLYTAYIFFFGILNGFPVRWRFKKVLPSLTLLISKPPFDVLSRRL